MREKETYSRPEMEVLRFGDRTIITQSPCDCDGQFHVTVKISNIPNMTFGSKTDSGSFSGCGYDIGLPIFGAN